MKKLITLLTLFLTANISHALEMRAVKVLDSMRASRANYSSSERITLFGEVYSQTKEDRINFSFIIYDPSSRQVFKHTGNSIPGSIGTGGSEVSNVSISQFYTSPGSYSMEVSAQAQGGASVTQKTNFAVYSPIILLTYPANGMKDIVDQTLTFRWVGSGASKYKIYVDDDQSFYNTLLTADTFDTSYAYPQNPSDPRQRLSGGQIYYWKVEGLDAQGNKVASTQVPSSFSLKQSAASSSARDLAITSILLSNEPNPQGLPIKVELKNLGGRTESNVTLTLYLGGTVAGTQKVDTINAGEARTVTFAVQVPELTPGQPLFASVMHDLYDDNMQNNILTAPLNLPDDYFKNKFAKIIGKVSVESKNNAVGKGIENAKISFSGPKSGEVLANSGGEYKIENLLSGMYILNAVHPDYEPQEKTVTIDKSKAYPTVDFILKEKQVNEYTLSEIWDIIKGYLSDEILQELDSYQLSEIKGVDKEELSKLIDKLKENKASISEASVSY